MSSISSRKFLEFVLYFSSSISNSDYFRSCHTILHLNCFFKYLILCRCGVLQITSNTSFRSLNCYLISCFAYWIFHNMFVILGSSAWSILIDFCFFIILLILYWVNEKIIFIKHTNLHLLSYYFSICSVFRSDSAVCYSYKISFMYLVYLCVLWQFIFLELGWEYFVDWEYGAEKIWVYFWQLLPCITKTGSFTFSAGFRSYMGNITFDAKSR